jgi:hypothetical protein
MVKVEPQVQPNQGGRADVPRRQSASFPQAGS